MKVILKEVKCPSCGGKIRFDPATQANKCESCDSSFIINEYDSIDELSKDNAKSKCPNCGACLEFDPATQKAVCHACDSEFNIIRLNDTEDNSIDFTPDYIVPFTITKGQAQKAIIKQLAGSNDTPDDIFDKAVIKSLEGFYLPLYAFAGKYDSDWTAEVGHDYTEQEEYYDYEYKNGERIRVRKVRDVTKTRWDTTTGRRTGTYFVSVSSFKHENFLNMDKSFLKTTNYSEFIEDASWNKKGIVDYDDRYLAGFQIVPFGEKQNYLENRRENEIEEIVTSDVSSNLQADKVRDVSVSFDAEDENQYTYLMPFWIAEYSYNGKPYYCIIQGNNVTRLLSYEPPDIRSNDLQAQMNKRLKSNSMYIKSVIIFYILALVLFAAPLTIGIPCAFLGAYNVPINEISDFGKSLMLYGIVPAIILTTIWLALKSKNKKLWNSYIAEKSDHKREKAQEVLKNIEYFFSRSEANDISAKIGKREATKKLINSSHKNSGIIAIMLIAIIIIITVSVVITTNSTKYNSYLGTWNTKDNDNGLSYSLAIDIISGNAISGNLTVTSPKSSEKASINFSSTLDSQGKLQYNYDNDGVGNDGTLYLEFKNSCITLSIENNVNCTSPFDPDTTPSSGLSLTKQINEN